ncbi:MAG: PBP1A family penicillin-binding protein [Deltaproteobacteria bacterium]|jgi:penicillin-binding protein 1A|nr:PBP1A family penicillin-binding protein [Deltaproteobacteria bacterium]
MKRILLRCFVVLLILGALGACAGAGLIFWVSRDLPSYTRISDYRPPQVTTVYARDGSIMGYFYDEKRFMVSLAQMPPHLSQAFLAAEDSSFYEHDGISFKAILRAFVINTISGSANQGGSTITQQVVKRILLTPERSYIRKIREAILSYRLETYLSKDDILNIYLNQIYLGSGAYGVESAARTYFNKHVEDLALHEAAVLAGLPQSPSKVNPYADPAGSKNRQRYVLRRMLDEGMISQAEHDQAVAEPLVYSSMPEPSKVGAWYLEEVRRDLIKFLSEQNVRDLNLPLERYGRDALYNAGLNVHTSMEPVHQEAAEQALRQGLLDLSKRQGWQGALTSLPIGKLETYLARQLPPEAVAAAEPPASVAEAAELAVKAVTAALPRFMAAPVVPGDPTAPVASATPGDSTAADAAAPIAPLVENTPDLAEIERYLGPQAFKPADLDNAGWAQAVVVKVDKKEAQLRLGLYSGVISTKRMEWCRLPNMERAPEESGQIRTPDKVLKVGDVVWVSAVGGSGKANPLGAPAGGNIPPYDSSAVKPDSPIALSLEQMPAVDGALVSMEIEHGDVVALVGGYTSPPENHFNRATQGRRQPGSSFKPIVYSAALDLDFTAASMINDAPIVGSTGREDDSIWRPSNFDGIFYGPILLRTALVRSRNLCTIRLAQQIGLTSIIERANLLGIDGAIPHDLSISLGSYAVPPITMAEAYSSFASGGQRVRPRLVEKVTDNWGRPVVSFVPEKTPTISPQNAYLMSSLLKDAARYATGNRTRELTRVVGGKTGTTNEERDAWFTGFSPFLVSTIYVGFDESRPLGKFETGSRAAVPVFVRYRKEIEQLYPDEDFPKPEGITTLSVDESNGFLSGAYTEKSVILPFLTGTEPTVVSGAPIRRGDDDLGSAIDLFKQ